jgi:hypothetical protein
MSYACGKRYYVCVTCMLWCSNTESVPLLVSNIHIIILVRTQYILVCTSLYYYTIPVPVCTQYVPVRTSYEQVHTKYPVPVMRLTIPDGSARLPPGPGPSPPRPSRPRPTGPPPVKPPCAAPCARGDFRRRAAQDSALLSGAACLDLRLSLPAFLPFPPPRPVPVPWRPGPDPDDSGRSSPPHVPRARRIAKRHASAPAARAAARAAAQDGAP